MSKNKADEKLEQIRRISDIDTDYADNDLDDVISHYLGNENEIQITTTAQSSSGELIRVALESFKNDVSKTKLLIPVHDKVNGHYTALYVEKKNDGTNKIIYFDPRGREDAKFSKEKLAEITQSLQDANIVGNIQVPKSKIQIYSDTLSNNNCGPYVCYLLVRFGKGSARINNEDEIEYESKDEWKKFNLGSHKNSIKFGQDIRILHHKILQEKLKINDDLEEAFEDLNLEEKKDDEVDYSQFLGADLSDDSEEEIVDGDSIRKRVKSSYKKQNHQVLDADKDEQFIPLFRGTKFLEPFFDNSSRRKSALLTDHSDRDIFSNMAFRNSGLKKSDMGKYSTGDLQKDSLIKLQAASLDIIKFFNILNKIEGVNVKMNSKYVYEIYYFLLQVNTNLYDKFNDTLKKLSEFLVGNQKKYGLGDDNIAVIKSIFKDIFEDKDKKFDEKNASDRKPIVSTGADPYNASMYALPVFEEDTFELDGFDPKYDEKGKPKHRFGGMVHIMLLPVSVYEREIAKEGKRQNDNKSKVEYEGDKSIPEFSDIQLLHQRRLLNIKTRIANSSQSELAFIGKVSKDYVVSHVPVYFPNFSEDKKFTRGYHDVIFGIKSETIFKEIQKKFKDGKDVKEITQEITGILKEHIGNICYDIAAHISGNRLNIPKINKNGDVEFGQSTRKVTLHSRLQDNDDAPSPSPKKISKEDSKTNIGFDSSPVEFSNKSKKGGYYLGE